MRCVWPTRSCRVQFAATAPRPPNTRLIAPGTNSVQTTAAAARTELTTATGDQVDMGAAVVVVFRVSSRQVERVASPMTFGGPLRCKYLTRGTSRCAGLQLPLSRPRIGLTTWIRRVRDSGARCSASSPARTYARSAVVRPVIERAWRGRKAGLGRFGAGSASGRMSKRR